MDQPTITTPKRWTVPAVLMLLLAGCASYQLTQSEPFITGEFADPRPVCNSNASAAAPAPPAKAPPPRNVFEAVCAYFQCLRTYPCNKDEAKKGADEQEGKKNPDADKDNGAGKKGANGNGKADKNGKDQPEGKKDPDGKDDAGKKDDKNGADQPEGKKNPDTNEEKKGNGDDKKADETNQPQWFSAHGQATVISQVHDHFRSPYIGLNSLLPSEPPATSETSTLFLATRLWEGGDMVFNPEIAGGRGFSGTTGVAGFPNGEITRVGTVEPTPYIARLFFRQTIGLGGEQEKVEDAPNLIAGKRDIDRFTVTLGKFSATDVLDDNAYSHDPRTHFMNWSLMYNGAWDYPANVRGYNYGMALELNRKYGALRYLLVGEPVTANGAPIDRFIVKAHGQAVEYEQRWGLEEHEKPGHLRLMAYLNNAHMGDYQETLAQMPVNPDITQTAAYRIKYGFGLSFDHALTKNLGLFGRLGWNDGHTESWAFTEIDRTASLGLVLKGACWCRPNDEVGLAGVINGLSQDHRNYLAAGGVGFIIGDGQLSYAPEQILEMYYDCQVYKGVFATIDFQEVNHPAYNSDRGPVSIWSLRVHIEF